MIKLPPSYIDAKPILSNRECLLVDLFAIGAFLSAFLLVSIIA